MEIGELSTKTTTQTKALLDKGWAFKEQLYKDIFEHAEYLRKRTSPAISIVVISWRLHPDTVKNFKILSQQRNQNFELIFVDNGGKPEEFDILKPFIDTYIKLNTNTGAYLARNIGSVFANAPILFFLEDDGIPDQKLVKSHLDTHRKYDVIAVRGVYQFKDPDKPENAHINHYYLGTKPFPIYADVEGNASYNADIFYKVGGWDDEIIFGGGGVNLSRRLCDIEPDMRKQIYSPEPIILHDYATDKNHLETKKAKQETLEKHKEKSFPTTIHI